MSGYPEYGKSPGQPFDGYGGQYGQQFGQYTSNNTTVVTSQPNVLVVPSNGPPPSNYMALAVISCLCCVWPIGLAAVIFSSLSSDSARSGDYEGARTKGKVSLGLALTSIFLGVAAIIIILVVYFTVGFGYYYYEV